MRACTLGWIPVGILVIIVIIIANIETRNRHEKNLVLKEESKTKKQPMDSIYPFYGFWKYGQRHKSTCKRYHVKACCENQLRFHFVFYEDHLNQIHPVKKLKSFIKNKSMLLVGDSVMLQFYENIAEILNIEQPAFEKLIRASEGRTTLRSSINHGLGGNLTYFRGHTVVLKGELPFITYGNWISETHLRSEIIKHDIIILNMGLHYPKSNWTADQYRIHFQKVGNVLINVTHNTSKRVIIRSTTPQHFRSRYGIGSYEQKDVHSNKCYRKLPKPYTHFTNFFLKEMAAMFGFSFLDNFPIYYERGDLHYTNECTHFCYTAETVWPELALLTELLNHNL